MRAVLDDYRLYQLVSVLLLAGSAGVTGVAAANLIDATNFAQAAAVMADQNGCQPSYVGGFGSAAVFVMSAAALVLEGLAGFALLYRRSWGRRVALLAMVPLGLLWLDGNLLGYNTGLCDTAGVTGAGGVELLRAGLLLVAGLLICYLESAWISARTGACIPGSAPPYPLGHA